MYIGILTLFPYSNKRIFPKMVLSSSLTIVLTINNIAVIVKTFSLSLF